MERSSCKEFIERYRVQIRGKIHPEIYSKVDEKFYVSLIQKPAVLPFNYFGCGFPQDIRKLYHDKVIYGKIPLQRVHWIN